MRFAYIDSQGNEVSIPSVDALALRIELGAIGPETQLFDAQADRWGPAKSHEIYVSLSRGSDDEAGFVAPPPPVEASAEEEQELGLDVEPEAPSEPPPGPPPPPPPSGDLAMDLGITDAQLAASTPPPVADDSGSDPFGPGGIEGLELAATFPSHPDDSPAHGESSMEPLELESPLDAMDFSTPGVDETAVEEVEGGNLGEEQPGPFLGDEPPAWPEQAGPEPADDEPVMDFSRTKAARDEEAQAPSDKVSPPRRRERPKPRSRPSPPRRSRRPALGGVALFVVAVGVIGGGGYYGWGFLSEWGRGNAARSEAEVIPEVTLPDIPAELLPQMRELGEGALAEMITALQGLPEELGLPAEPRDDWLAGAYLANAADFGDVEEYWLGIETLVDRVSEVDAQVFHDEYVDQLGLAGISGDAADMLLERADSGFLATRAERFEAYALMDDLINAALDLHTFLIQKQDSISYEPAGGGMSRDPVLEAMPATPVLGESMWEGVDRITEALDALGTLDRVTTERLVAVLLDQVRRAGFQ